MRNRRLTPNDFRRLNRAERRVERCQCRYSRTRSHAALVALKKAVTAALKVNVELGLGVSLAGARSGRTAETGVRNERA
jgi:hypothetical protein